MSLKTYSFALARSWLNLSKSLAFLLLFFGTESFFLGTESHAAERGLWVSPSLAYFRSDDLGEIYGQKSFGLGLVGAYEFSLSPKFSLLMDLGYRVYRDTYQLSQLTYGLSLMHALQDPSQSNTLYLAYGLNVQNIKLEGVSQSALAHDTRLSVGYLTTKNYFVDFAYHISSLRYFGISPKNVDYFALGFGYRFQWR